MTFASVAGFVMGILLPVLFEAIRNYLDGRVIQAAWQGAAVKVAFPLEQVMAITLTTQDQADIRALWG